MLEGIEYGVVHALRHEQRADRDVTAGEGLRHRDEVGLETPMVECEQPAGAAESGLHLVDGEQRAVAATQFLRSHEESLGREVDAVSLHGLDEEERDVLTLQLLLERVDVSPRDVRELRQERAESLREVGVTARGERLERQAEETALRRDDARTAGDG